MEHREIRDFTKKRTDRFEWQRRSTMTDLEMEAEKLMELLKGKTVKIVWRHRPDEIAIEFDDRTRLFVNRHADGLDISVT
jgi:hypothetical protein